jgi:hypothetical protein
VYRSDLSKSAFSTNFIENICQEIHPENIFGNPTNIVKNKTIPKVPESTFSLVQFLAGISQLL